ncbi:pectinesterase inhibitor [Sesamum indicum]|uniref:Pectinesterase inhibitor n=1 Tax=Sesamum indicum TaxID=4182 RepID=A0A6I9UAR8_SESIN|nr:pectinesterase inhibitor [Sesamum indicum]
MAYSSHKILSIALLMLISVPSSLGRPQKSETETDLRDLCSNTRKPKQCWKIIKPQLSSFDVTDSRSVAGAVIDLAVAKAQEIHDKLNQLFQDSRDDKLKEKYISCSKNYNDANRNLDLAKRNLDSNDYQNIPVQVDDTLEELKSCRHEFDKDSFDPAHIKNRNKEFGVYVDIVKVATDRLLREDDRLQENARH